MDKPQAAMRIRTLEPADEPPILRLFEAAASWFENATGGPSGPGDVQSLLYALPEGASPQDKSALVVTVGGTVVGVIDVIVRHPDEVSAACGLFLIDPARRGQGLGRAVAAHLLDRARLMGIRRVTLTLPGNEAVGRTFARDVGFVEDVEPASHDRTPSLLRATLALG